MEKQFLRYYKEAANRPGQTGHNLLIILESRLDNVIYRAGLARTRRQARQLVTHGHFELNGVRIDMPEEYAGRGPVGVFDPAGRCLALVEEQKGRAKSVAVFA